MPLACPLKLTATPVPVPLRRAAGLVRAHDRRRLAAAVLTGCPSRRALAVIHLLPVARAVLLRSLRRMRRCGTHRVLVSLLGDTLVVGATQAIDLPEFPTGQVG